MENENSELKFKIQILELQLQTLKKKNNSDKDDKNKLVDIQSEIGELLKEQFAVSARVNRILNLLKDL